MQNKIEQLLSAFDGHNIGQIRAAIASGVDPTITVKGKSAIGWLLEEYTRSDRLSECVSLLIEHGAKLQDPNLIPILLDDSESIKVAAKLDPAFLDHRTNLKCAFTSLENASLLHVAAEYGNFKAAHALLEAGADPNCRTGLNQMGCNGHTPLFHTVNSHNNRSEPIMRLLLDFGAKADTLIPALHWGADYEWETIFFDVTPISFAQMGLLPQVHRSEEDIYSNIRILLSSCGRIPPTFNNVPNRYLRKG